MTIYDFQFFAWYFIGAGLIGVESFEISEWIWGRRTVQGFFGGLGLNLIGLVLFVNSLHW